MLNSDDHAIYVGPDEGSLEPPEARGRLLLVYFTERPGVIRLISARRATRHERQDYEEATRS